MSLARGRRPVLKTLHLLRHAKTIEGPLHGTDHARFLTPRGLKAAKTMAEHLKVTGFAVDKIFSSTARRTRETYEAIAPALGGATVAFRDRLYLIDSSDLMDFIHGLPDKADSVLIIGHNPAFHHVALNLTKGAAGGNAEGLAALKEKFPTGALCSLQFDIAHWSDVKPGAGTLTAFVRPRDLDGD